MPGVCLCLRFSVSVWDLEAYCLFLGDANSLLNCTVRGPPKCGALCMEATHMCTDPCQYVPFLSVPGPCPPPTRRTTSYRYHFLFFFTHVGARTTVDVWDVDDKSAQGLSQCTALHCSENCENLRVAAVAGCCLLMLTDFRCASVRACMCMYVSSYYHVLASENDRQTDRQEKV